MNVAIHPSWEKYLKKEFDSDYFKKLISFVKEEYKSKQIYPSGQYIFRAFNECPFEQCKVVILGQDPYHTEGVANGLSFSVNPAKKYIPPSLKNIYKELASDLDKTENQDGDLS